ncbi:MAG TPA: LysR substrate-binding domain-containing protein [Myxococcales bacterium]|nr:LysR substrate-binding domain-containing protein [Myxococcales bacterium]
MGPHPFSLRQLQYAVAVADTGGFRRAAAQCRVSQPSLSAQVAQLEQALGARLFERGQRKVLLTAAGADLLPRARQLLTLADDLVAGAARLSDPFCGTLRIGVIPTISPYLLPEVAPALGARFPRLTLHWSEDRTEPLLRSLREGRIDAALLARVPGMQGLAQEPIAREPFVLAGAPSQPLLKSRKPVRLAELQGASLLLLEDGHCFREQALAVCAGGRAQEAGYRATSLATLARVAASGAGVTLLPSLSLAVENRHGELATRRFTQPEPARELVLAFRAQSPLAAAFRELAAAMAAAVPARP